MTREPTVGLVVLTYNGAPYVDALAYSIMEQTSPPLRIVVVDNASHDDTVDRIRTNLHGRRMQLVVNDSNYGCARGYNIGACLCDDVDVLCFLNQDIVLHRDYCATVARRFAAEPGLTALQPLVISARNRELVENCGHTIDAWLTTRTVAHFAPLVPAPQVPEGILFTLTAPAVRRSTFRALGGFDEDLFIYYEDTDLALRIWANGGRVGFEPGAVVWHVQEGSSRAFADDWRTYLWVRNRIRLLWKHAQGPSGYVRAGVVVVVALGAMLALLPIRPRDAVAVGRALGWNILHCRSTWAARRSLMRVRVRSMQDLRSCGVLRKSEGLLPLVRRGLRRS